MTTVSFHPRVPALPLVAGAFLCGVAAASLLGIPWWMTACGGGLVIVAGSAPRLERDLPLALLVAVALAALLGHLRFEAAGESAPTALTTIRGEHEVVATISDDPRVRGLYARIDLDVSTIDGLPVDGGLRVTFPAPLDPLRAGDRLRMSIELEDPPEIEDFDYAGFLAGRGIYAVGSFPKSWAIEGHETDWRSPFRWLRHELNANIERTLPAPESALAAGVLVGERGTMPEQLTEDLRQTGTTHLVVVSGQNVALLLGIAISLLTLAVPRRRASLGLLFALPFYVVLVGADPPVVRAAVMAVGIVIASVLGRRTPGWIYLVYAAALMVAWDPSLARDVAFQLSATATAGVMVIAPAITAFVLTRLRWPESGVRATIVELASTATAATLTVLPVQVAAFERVSIVAIPANVIVAPLYEATVFVAAVAAVAGSNDITAPAARPLLTFVPGAFIWVVEALAAFPGGEFPVRAPLVVGAVWYAGLVGVTWLAGRFGERTNALESSGSTTVGWSVGLAVVAAGLWLSVLQPAPNDARVTFLDVGNGLAVLIEDDGQRVLFDVGPPDGSVVLSLPPEVGHLDAVLVSHADADHAGGLATVLGRYTTDALLADDRTLEDLHARLPAASAGRPLDIGDRLVLSARTSIEVLSPPVASRGIALDSDNDGSLVILVTVGTRRILVTADIESAAETWLVESGVDLEADVLLVPHHGSKTSSSEAFLEAVAPGAAVVSVSASNTYGHPADEVLARYEGIPLFRTDEDGNVSVSSDGKRLWIKTER